MPNIKAISLHVNPSITPRIKTAACSSGNRSKASSTSVTSNCRGLAYSETTFDGGKSASAISAGRERSFSFRRFERLKRMRNSQPRQFVPRSNWSNARHACKNASCTRSSAVERSPRDNRKAIRRRLSVCGNATSSKSRAFALSRSRFSDSACLFNVVRTQPNRSGGNYNHKYQLRTNSSICINFHRELIPGPTITFSIRPWFRLPDPSKGL